MLKHRIITAIILIPLIVWGILDLPWAGFATLTAIILALAAWEWSRLMGLMDLFYRWLYVIMMLLTFLLVHLYLSSLLILSIGVIWWLLATVLILYYPKGSIWWGKGFVWRGAMGFLTFVPCWTGLNVIRFQKHGYNEILFILILVWLADTSAYFYGQYWGRAKLLPKVSPSKTWAGLIGGIFVSLIGAMLGLWILNVPLEVWALWVLIALLSILFSVVGDLMESALKRQVGVKDSGHLLPGHGGLLDRIDSLLAAVPFFAICIQLITL